MVKKILFFQKKKKTIILYTSTLLFYGDLTFDMTMLFIIKTLA
jgi:hypothetical protein